MAANRLYCKLCTPLTEEVKVADLTLERDEETMVNRFIRYARRETGHNRVSFIERINTPWAVILVLVFFIALDGLLFLLYR